jgi:anti-sigma regulatory factor (Ser/Thr protein kinase)
MKSDQTASVGRPPHSTDGCDPHPASGELEAKCRHQAKEIDTLGEAVSAFQRGARALKAENTGLRAENDRLRRYRSRLDGRADGGAPAEAAIPIGVQAPGIARRVVAQWLADHVAPSVLETTLLLVSELVSNSVRHSGVPEGEELVVRVHLCRDCCRLEVEDPGCDGVIAPRRPDPFRGGGMGLHLVQALSERWGLDRIAAGGTRVWAQLPRAPLSAPVPVRAESSDARGTRSSSNGNPNSARAAAMTLQPRRPKEPHDRAACHPR